MLGSDTRSARHEKKTNGLWEAEKTSQQKNSSFGTLQCEVSLSLRTCAAARKLLASAACSL